VPPAIQTDSLPQNDGNNGGISGEPVKASNQNSVTSMCLSFSAFAASLRATSASNASNSLFNTAISRACSAAADAPAASDAARSASALSARCVCSAN